MRPDPRVGELRRARERPAAAPVEGELGRVEQRQGAVDLEPGAVLPRGREGEEAVRAVAAAYVEADDACGLQVEEDGLDRAESDAARS